MLTPDQIAKSDSEHAHQAAFFAYIAVAQQYGWEVARQWAQGHDFDNIKYHIVHEPIEKLKWIHAIPNGGSRGKIQGAKLKAEGVKSGVLDVFFPVPNPHYTRFGLYIEFKKPDLRGTKDGGLSRNQIEFGDFVYHQGFEVKLCYTWKEAVDVVYNYLYPSVREAV